MSSADDTFAAYQYSNSWFGTARGRADIAFSNVALYAIAGLAYGGERLNFVSATETHTIVGWTADGSIDAGLTRNWSTKAEYLYFDLGGQNYALTAVNDLSSGLIRLGVNFGFESACTAGAPAETDIQEYFRLSPPSIHQMVLTLERTGLIRRQPRTSRSIQLLVDPSPFAAATLTLNSTGQNHSAEVLQRFPFIVDHRPCVLTGEAW